MFQRILVPLDGSRRAEHAIALAARLAHASEGTLIFVRAVLPPHEIGIYAAEWEQSVVVRPGAYEKHLAEAEAYLAQVTRAYASELQGINTELDIETGAVAPAILSAARLEAIDLIVLCSHGETGLTRWILGSVARETMRQSPVPVLVLNESGGLFLERPAVHPVRILVPLDGSTLSEEALQPALQLLAATSAPHSPGELHLLHVVDLPAAYGQTRSQANVTTNMHKEAHQEAETYLKTVALRLLEQLPAERPHITWSVAANSDVVAAILTQAATAHEEGNDYDIITLATHGHSGLRRLITGSVATRLLGESAQPLLIVHPQQSQQKKTPMPERSATGTT